MLSSNCCVSSTLLHTFLAFEIKFPQSCSKLLSFYFIFILAQLFVKHSSIRVAANFVLTFLETTKCRFCVFVNRKFKFWVMGTVISVSFPNNGNTTQRNYMELEQLCKRPFSFLVRYDYNLGLHFRVRLSKHIYICFFFIKSKENVSFYARRAVPTSV